MADSQEMSLSSLSLVARSRPWLKWLIVAILAAVIAGAAVPQYISGQWPWHSPPIVPQIRAIRGLKDAGLKLEGWSQSFQQKIPIGGDEWSVQQLTHTDTAAEQQMILFLKPQGQSKDQPEVEWIDLKGAQKWQTSHHRRLRTENLSLDTFQAWTSNQTFAVAQWYALPGGGHPAPHYWFWRDQLHQWSKGERLPWVAVSVLVSMPALGDVSQFSSELENLSQLVQAALRDTVFAAEA